MPNLKLNNGQKLIVFTFLPDAFSKALTMSSTE